MLEQPHTILTRSSSARGGQSPPVSMRGRGGRGQMRGNRITPIVWNQEAHMQQQMQMQMGGRNA